MKKEIVISVIVGLIFGLIITYGVYTARNAFQNPPAQSVIENNPSPSPSADVDALLAIHSPEDETIQTSPEVTIAGATTPKNYVVVFVNDLELITTADESGHFSVESELESGSNVIAVTTIDEAGVTTTVERTVIFSTTPLIDEEVEAASQSGETNDQ